MLQDLIATYRDARIRKDRNFDGRFVFGVTTTGIFCRPSCPSPVANEANVRYFDTLYQAMDEGFRPCLRCRPDMTGWTPHPDVEGGTVVQMALELIQSGFLHHHTIAELAGELLVSDRHLRGLFTRFLGASPARVAACEKARFAKRLLLESEATVTEVAHSAGFGSIRQFNTVFKKTFGKTPSGVREGSVPAESPTGPPVHFLKYDASFDFSQILGFLKRRELSGIEQITDNRYARTFRTDSAEGFLVVTDNPEKSALELRIFTSALSCSMEIVHRIRKVFDLDTDFTEIKRLFASDPILEKGLEHGSVPRLPVAFDPFEFTVRAILGQQVTVRAATTLASRLVKRTGTPTPDTFPEGLDLFFPEPATLLNADIGDLGITKTRQATLKTVSAALVEGNLSLSCHQNPALFRKSFLALKGIGEWTVQYVAMRGLGMPDSFPAADLGVLRALERNGRRPSPKEALALAESWRPYRAYATLCLWNRDAKEEK